MLEDLAAIVGAAQVLTGADMARYSRDWAGTLSWTPRAVVRPASTREVSEVLRVAHAARVPVVPVAGNTGVSGGTMAEGALMLSLERMRAVREIRPAARIAIVEAGVVLADLHAATAAHGLTFPVTLGARGTAMIGGILSTHAGGSNVLRHGPARGLCLGVEAVLADGTVLDLMSALRKDNTGYDLRDLLIGSEGTLAILTAAVLRLAPLPRAHATALVAVPDLSAALVLLNRLQDETGGAVEAFEWMPAAYHAAYDAAHPGTRAPLSGPHETTVLVEVAATAARAWEPGADGAIPVVRALEETLGEMFDAGLVADATVARSEAERAALWARREAAAELALAPGPFVSSDVAVPLDAVATFVARADAAALTLDSSARFVHVGHLGDGNVHHTVRLSRDDADLQSAVAEAVEDIAMGLGGTFSAEHGIGTKKRAAMARRKPPEVLEAMRKVKAALDPEGILNPGKVLP